MDHLPRPRTSTAGASRVPYICRLPYDDAGFLGYPTRFLAQIHQQRNAAPTSSNVDTAFDWVAAVLPDVSRAPFWLTQRQNPCPDDELASFFQSWIFFGLLHELLAPHDLYDAANFIGRDEQGNYVHTRRLEAKLHAWVRAVNQMNDGQKQIIKTRLMTCLQLAYTSMRCFLPSQDEPSAHPNFDRTMLTSLASICETVSAVGEMVLGGDWLLFNMWAKFSAAEKADMENRDWCPSLIGATEKDFGSVAGHFYLQNMDQPALGVDHSGCTINGCEKLQIDDATYSPAHVDESCRCATVGPDFEEVAACLEQDSFPVLQVTEGADGRVTIRVAKYEADIAFVALSHVWVDGLGNPRATALPRCQIVRMSRLVKQIEGQSFLWGVDPVERREERTLHLWCDSLTCPVVERAPDGHSDEELETFQKAPSYARSKTLKSKAIGKLRDVYQNAAYVLVLDRGLDKTSVATAGWLEASMRVMTSRWTQRLWTYQEAGLPQKLLIQFADGVVDFRTLVQLARDTYRTDPVLRSICFNLTSRCADLRAFQFLQAQGGPDLLRLQSALRCRRVSYATDEPICLATFMGIDTKTIDEESQTCTGRMQTFWRLLAETERGIPDDIIFNEFPRLNVSGYSWAPITIQQDLQVTERRFTNPSISGRATLSDLGLHVRRPGWKLQLPSMPWATSREWEGQYFGGDRNFLFVQGPAGLWYSASQSGRSYARPLNTVWNFLDHNHQRDLYILLEKSEGANEGREAILGYISSEDNVFQPAISVTVRPLEPYWQIIRQAASQHANTLWRHNTFQSYQFCRALETKPNDIVPHPHLHWIARYWIRFYTWRFGAQLQRMGDSSFQTQEVATAMRIASRAIGPTDDGVVSISGHIGVMLMGRYAIVEEELDGGSEWIVS